jgi:hypothetical protein
MWPNFMYIGTFSNNSERTKQTCNKFLIPGSFVPEHMLCKKGFTQILFISFISIILKVLSLVLA